MSDTRTSLKRTTVLLATLLALAALPFSAPSAGASQTPDYDRRHILVGWERNATKAQKSRSHDLVDGVVAHRLRSIDVDVVSVPRNLSPQAWVKRYEHLPNVAFAELNHKVRATSVPSETIFNEQWGYHNSGQRITGSLVRGAADWDIDAPEAWDVAYGPGNFPSGGGTRVAIIDTGIDRTHLDLMSKVKACASALAAIGVVVQGSCSDDNFHGTHVAGTVAATTNNGLGVAGTAPDAELAIFKALNAAGVGFVGDIAAASSGRGNRPAPR